jgi:hypothetical protein
VTLTLIVQEELGAIVPLFNVTEVPPLSAVRVAEVPQPLSCGDTGSARKILAGRSSRKEAWVRLRPISLLVITMDNRLTLPAQIVAGLKLLLIEGLGLPVTFNVALAGVVLEILSPSPVELSAPAGIVLMRLLGVEEVTLTDTVHDPGVDPDCAGTVPPLRDRVVPPAAAFTVPPQELIKPTGFAMVSPGWTPTKLSVQEASVNGNELGLKMVTRRREVAPVAMEMGEKLLLISAGREI